MKRHLHPIGNNQITLYEAICDIENLKLAHKNARKGKGWYKEVIVILHGSKEYLHFLIPKIINYLREDGLTVKDNWQIFPTYTRGLDFVGYRIFDDFILLRKSTYKSMKKKMLALRRKEELTFNDYCSIQSYIGWLRHCNSYRLQLKYTVPLLERRNNGNTS